MSLSMVPLVPQRDQQAIDSLNPADMPSADIVLHHSDCIYTPETPVQGSLKLQADQSLDCATCRLSLEGDVRLNPRILSGLSAPGPFCIHPFLRLDHPIDESDWTRDSLHLTSSSPKTIHFSFNLPSKLLDSSCKHWCVDDVVQDAHSGLLPSLGDRITKNPCMDNMGPLMGQVHYCVVFRATISTPNGSSPLTVRKHIRVMPTIAAGSPPGYGTLDIPPAYEWNESLRNAIGRKMGTLCGSLLPLPPASLVAPDFKANNAKISPLAVDLLYEPTASVPYRNGSVDSAMSDISMSEKLPTMLPKLNSVEVRLTVKSTVATKPMEFLTYEESDEGTERTRVTLPWHYLLYSGKINDVRWQAVESRSTRVVAYQGRVLIPITLPMEEAIAPTFHSCYVARTYILDVKLNMGLPKTLIYKTIKFSLPLVVEAS